MKPVHVHTGIELPVYGPSRYELRAVEIRDRQISEIIALSTRLDNIPLHEWWIIPAYRFGWTERDLDEVLMNSWEDLLAYYSGLTDNEFVRQQYLFVTRKLRESICHELTPTRSAEDFFWNFELVDIPKIGRVLSVVFGDRGAMVEVYRQGLRKKQAQPAL